MNRIEIRELRLKNGEWVNSVAAGEERVITDRGRVASLHAVRLGDLSTPFRQRRTLVEFDALPRVSGDSNGYISEDRDRG